MSKARMAGGTPLDLRAVEARLNSRVRWIHGGISDEAHAIDGDENLALPQAYDIVRAQALALLAHCRALRAALELALAVGDEHRGFRSDTSMHDYNVGRHDANCRWCRAAAVLAQVRDE